MIGLLLSFIAAAFGGGAAPQVPQAQERAGEVLAASTYTVAAFSFSDLRHAIFCMVVATLLGTLLAFRPRRAGGPPRVAHITQAQIMMAMVGSLVMLIVGASLARAFAIAGTAGLVRYRAKIDDPKDASVMLSCLAIGLASGVGLLYLATAAAVFIIGILWLLEWRTPWPPKRFDLKVAAKNPATLKPEVETLLKNHRITFELRELTEEHIAYSALVPEGKRTDRISEAIVALHGDLNVNVEWDEKKVAK